MDFFEDTSPYNLRSLARSYSDWVDFYRQNRRDVNYVWCGYNTKRDVPRMLDNVIWGAGTTINLFPHTQYTIAQPCFPSANEAWFDDWYKIGLDLYEILAKVNLEELTANVRDSAKDGSRTEPAVR